MDIYYLFSFIPMWFWTLVLVLVLTYYYLNQAFSQHEALGIKTPVPQFLFGNFKQLTRGKGMVLTIQELCKKYGNVYGLYFGRKLRIIVSDLDMLKEVFVKDFQHFTDRETSLTQGIVSTGVFFETGHNWKRIRNIITPTFSSGKLKNMHPTIYNCGKVLTKNIEEVAAEGKLLDVKHSFGAYTMDVIASTAFGINLDSQTNPDEPLVMNARKLFKVSSASTFAFAMSMSIPVTRYIFNFLNIGFFPNVVIQFFVKSIREMVKQRKEDHEKRSDFLQLLLDAESVEEENGNLNIPDSKIIKKLSSDEVLGQAFLFFIAGYETTATTLQYVSYMLAQNPEIQEKVIEEIRKHIGDRDATYEDINKLTYMEQVIQETLRYYPPVSMINRKASEDVNINGYHIPKGGVVTIPIYHIHHDPNNYPNPEQFNPDRFEKNAAFNPVAFLPFGYGPRLCIGLRLAMLEAKIALVTILQKVKFVERPETVKNVEFSNSGLLSPKETIFVGVELLNKS